MNTKPVLVDLKRGGRTSTSRMRIEKASIRITEAIEDVDEDITEVTTEDVDEAMDEDPEATSKAITIVLEVLSLATSVV